MADKDKTVLCRRELPSVEWVGQLCCRAIETPNVFNWCKECLAVLPVWPK